MGPGTTRLRERMVRAAIVDALRGLPVGEVAVTGNRAVVRLVLTAGWRSVPADLVTEAARRLESLAELDHFELAVIWDRQPTPRPAAQEKGTAMPTEAQRNVIERYTTDVWSKGDLDAVGEIFTPDRVRHGPDLEGTSVGSAGHKDLVALYRTSLPDLSITVESQAGDGDSVITRWRATGTNLGPTLGVPPTGRSFEVIGFWMHRFEAGRIAEEWATWDTHGFLQQIGVSLP